MSAFSQYTEVTLRLPAPDPRPLLKEKRHLLGSLEGQDGEDGPAVHSSHAGTVTHEAQQDGRDL